MIRRLAPLVFLLGTACGPDEAPAPEPVELQAPRPAGARPASDAVPEVPSRASPPAGVPDASPRRGPGPVGSWSIDPEDRKVALAGARKHVDEEIARRVAALPPERRARAEGYAKAAEAMVAQAIDALERVEITLDVREDGTAEYRSKGVGPDRTLACTWTEEGGLLVLSRTDAPVDDDGSDRRLRFRRTGDVLTKERPDGEERPGAGLAPIPLRRR